MNWVKLTNADTKMPVWVNLASAITLDWEDMGNYTRITFSIDSGTVTVTETPEEVLKRAEGPPTYIGFIPQRGAP
jgi:hypothetical protein